jgi:hypothetical protein
MNHNGTLSYPLLLIMLDMTTSLGSRFLIPVSTVFISRCVNADAPKFGPDDPVFVVRVTRVKGVQFTSGTKLCCSVYSSAT